MAVTDSAMPQRRTFWPISMISAAECPFRISVSTLSLPDSSPMYTMVRPFSHSVRSSSSVRRRILEGEA